MGCDQKYGTVDTKILKLKICHLRAIITTICTLCWGRISIRCPYAAAMKERPASRHMQPRTPRGHWTKDTRIREIAAEMLVEPSGLPLERVKDLFCRETGYQTPKLDSRAAIFRDGKVLLVQENDGRWSLPGSRTTHRAT